MTPIFSNDWVKRQLRLEDMPVDCLMFLISEPCWIR
jgi:hypothetical protein